MPSFRILGALALLAAAACQQQAEEQQPVEAGTELTRGIDRSHKGESFPDVTFIELDHQSEVGKQSLLGTPALVNLWATWCAPCVKELPSLDALAKRRMADLAVMPISQDVAPPTSVTAFLDRLNIQNVGRYHDPKMALSGALGVQVLPTTIFYDAEGREVWRYIGDLDWNGEEAARLLAEAGGGGSR